MKLTINIKPNSKKDEVICAEDGRYTVRVTVPPIEGKANEKVIELLSKHFKKPKSLISIIYGKKSRTKIVEIN